MAKYVEATLIDIIPRHELQVRCSSRLAEGWVVLFAIPSRTPSPMVYSNANTSSIYINTTTGESITFTPPLHPTSPGIDYFDVCFVRVSQDPCPRCNYPNVDSNEIGRES